VLSKAQLAQADGSDGRPVYLSILGDVFDVSSKPEFYGKGSGYHHFVGTDGSRAFVTGRHRGGRQGAVDAPLQLWCMHLFRLAACFAGEGRGALSQLVHP
jgi:predicted heme/steroid binding protein